MASLTIEPEAAPRRRRPRVAGSLATALTDHGSDVLLAVVVLVFAIILLVDVPQDYNVDSWLALVDGRLIWATGIPHHDPFNALTLGHRWTDEQWLSQLASYAVYRVGGLGLLGALNVLLFVAPIGAAIAVARRLGAPFRSVLVTIPICIALVSPSREIRTQEFAIPLFVATMALLSLDGRRESPRVFWCLPILVLWANLHGSATLGAALVVLYAATRVWERRADLRRDRSAWTRPLALAAGAVLAIMITPYGLSIIGYYHSTMVDPTLRQYVSEWQPVTSRGVSWVSLCLLSGGCLWAFGRRPSATTLWEKLALVLLTVGSIRSRAQRPVPRPVRAHRAAGGIGMGPRPHPQQRDRPGQRTSTAADQRPLCGAGRAGADRGRRGHDRPAVLVTRGEYGMTLVTGDAPIHYPAEAPDVFDVSGAGRHGGRDVGGRPGCGVGAAGCSAAGEHRGGHCRGQSGNGRRQRERYAGRVVTAGRCAS